MTTLFKRSRTIYGYNRDVSNDITQITYFSSQRLVFDYQMNVCYNNYGCANGHLDLRAILVVAAVN